MRRAKEVPVGMSLALLICSTMPPPRMYPRT